MKPAFDLAADFPVVVALLEEVLAKGCSPTLAAWQQDLAERLGDPAGGSPAARRQRESVRTAFAAVAELLGRLAAAPAAEKARNSAADRPITGPLDATP